MIDEVVSTTMVWLLGPADRYVTPVEYRGRTQITWDQLATACPPLGDSTVQSYVQRWGWW